MVMVRIAAQPFAFALEFRKAALVIIDMQRDFVEPGGFGETLGNDVSLLQCVVPVARDVLLAWRGAGGLVVHTRESHLPDLSDCPPAKRLRGNPTLRIGDSGPMGRILVRGEAGNQIVPELAPVAGEIVIDKPGKGAFHGTELHRLLAERGITQLVFMGVTTEVCVQTSMREANDRGYDCLLVEDGTGSYFPEFKAATLAMITAQGGIVGWTAMAGAVIDAADRCRVD
ncbi:cysteine hydrolase family protein [Lacisediminimonas sp.]|uniref:cysteine hydrolase family protein n=1 Tax=Lacisediminimonas sp. TaxID=3060582 RepID=UPI00271A8605|nr:isochorismatase family cysteine hydrolase [Lacisediminimonas sp.]MDO8298848.1 isochorismatase family cysteine hydrolase [Lacisediminimonas sp.]